MVRTTTQALLVLTDRLSALDMVLSCGAPTLLAALFALGDMPMPVAVYKAVYKAVEPTFDAQVPC